jgi:predicted GNAT family acetyltransferase
MAVELQLNNHNQGAFKVHGDVGQFGEMQVAINPKNIIVFHTEVSEAAEGKGFAKQLLNAMVEYARQHKLKVIALCPYTNAQFTKHPELYNDIWEKDVSQY